MPLYVYVRAVPGHLASQHAKRRKHGTLLQRDFFKTTAHVWPVSVFHDHGAEEEAVMHECLDLTPEFVCYREVKRSVTPPLNTF
jgi:hypothetical protein